MRPHSVQRRSVALVLLIGVSAFVACADEASPVDGSTADASPADAFPPDVGVPSFDPYSDCIAGVCGSGLDCLPFLGAVEGDTCAPACDPAMGGADCPQAGDGNGGVSCSEVREGIHRCVLFCIGTANCPSGAECVMPNCCVWLDG